MEQLTLDAVVALLLDMFLLLNEVFYLSFDNSVPTFFLLTCKLVLKSIVEWLLQWAIGHCIS